MSAEAKHFRLGLFVLGGALLAAAGAVALGAGAALRPKIHVETSVDESVAGLDAGSPVRYRGVHVGEVASIGFVNAFYAVEDNRVRIVLAMYPDRVKASVSGDPEEEVRKRIERGMRIRLASQGLTGGVYLELDYVDPKEFPREQLSWEPQYPYLPAVKSIPSRLIDRVEGILEQAGKIPFEEIGRRVSWTLEGVDRALKRIETAVAGVQELSTATTAAVQDFRKQLNEKFAVDLHALAQDLRGLLEKEVAPTLKGIRQAADRLPGTFEKTDAAIDRVASALRRTDRLLAEGEGSLDETLENLRAVTQDLREVTGTLKRYPASALFGEAPPRKEERR
jgi:ABC-type transporter Mla subunit MlaD